MKIRTGFVSNSSSSSFVIAVKGELTEDRVFDAIGVDEDSPFYSFAKEVASTLVSEIMDKITSPKELQDYWGYEHPDWELHVKEWKEERWLKEGYILHIGDASDENEGAEYWICRNGIHLEADGLIVHCEGGY